MRIALSLEVASGLFGSSYNYVKGVVEASFYRPMPRGHALGFHLFVGRNRRRRAVLRSVLHRRSEPAAAAAGAGHQLLDAASRNLLNTSIASHRYDEYAARALVEYAIPIWRRRGFVYGGDAFAPSVCSAWPARATSSRRANRASTSLPIDLTGDLGIRLDTYVGIFTISIANALSRISF